MKRMMLVVAFLPAGPGCALGFNLEEHYSRSIIGGPLSFKQDGETLAGTRENVMKVFPPSFIIPLDDGEMFIWRGSLSLGKGDKHRWESVMSFDADGKFMKTDPELLKAYCTVCWTDVSRFTGTQCPRCDYKLPKGRKLPVACEGVPCECVTCKNANSPLTPKPKEPKPDAPD